MRGPSNLENKHLRTRHASNIEIDKNKNQDSHSQSSDMNELRPTTPLGDIIETINDTIIINEDRTEGDYNNALGARIIVYVNVSRVPTFQSLEVSNKFFVFEFFEFLH